STQPRPRRPPPRVPRPATLVTEPSPRPATLSANALRISAAAASTDTVTVQNVKSAGRRENPRVPAFVLMIPPFLGYRSLIPRLERAPTRGIPETRTDQDRDREVLLKPAARGGG